MTRPRSILATCLLLAAALTLNAAESPLTLTPHEFKAGAQSIAAELGTLRVPQRHERPRGPHFTLRFVRLPRIADTNTEPATAPVVYLAGGPGGSGIDAGRGPRLPLFQRVRQVADVILLDQRGTGLSDPPPPCPETFAQAPDQPGEVDALRQGLNAMAKKCARFWEAKGVDLAAYSTVQSAHDLHALKTALGVTQLNLWGMSYGTHLAMATLRLHEADIARVVLMGSEGLHQTYKPPLQADRLLAELGKRYGDPALPGRVRTVLAQLAKKPVEITYPAGTGLPPKVVLSAFDLQLTTALALATTQTSRLLPGGYAAMEQGQFAEIAPFVLQTRQRFGRLAAMPLAMDLASGASPSRLAQITREERESVFGAALNFPFPQVGAGLDVPDLGEAFRAPLKTAVPTLFISGTLDGRTPPENAEEIRRGFSRSAHLILDGAGHDNELFLASPDLADRIAAFYTGADPKDQTIATPVE